MKLALLHRRAPALGATTRVSNPLSALGQPVRAMSILGTIFGIGEFEGARNQSLGRATGKHHAYGLALLDYVSMNSHPKFMLQKVLEDDTPFLMGHVLVGASQYLTPLMLQDSLEAVDRLTKVQQIAQEDELTTSEKLHVLALDAMVHGRHREAAVVYETLLQQDPSDLLALRCCYDLYLFLGDYKNVLSTVTRRLPFWSPNDTGYSHLLGMQAYGLQASGRVDLAEAMAEKALSMNGNDRWAFHTMLQVFEARGNANHGASYANQFKEAFDNGGPLERHLYFQWALYLLDLGNYDRIAKMLELFWRLHFAGEDISELGNQLLDGWRAVATASKVALHPLARVLRHSVVSYVGGKAPVSVERLAVEPAVDTARLETQLGCKPLQFSFSRAQDEREVVYSSVCKAFQAYAEERFEDATQLLLPVRGSLHVLGGTSVDQDLVNLLLVECASKCADLELAKLILNERLSERPQSAQCWSTYSRVSEAMGDTSAVRDAQNMSYVLGLGQGGNQTN